MEDEEGEGDSEGGGEGGEGEAFHVFALKLIYALLKTAKPSMSQF